MSAKHITYIRPADGTCQECGKVKELRPYGRGGKFVCFECAMKDEGEAKRRFGAILNAGPVVIDARALTAPLPAPAGEKPSEYDAARLRFVKRLHDMNETERAHLLRIEQPDRRHHRLGRLLRHHVRPLPAHRSHALRALGNHDHHRHCLRHRRMSTCPK